MPDYGFQLFNSNGVLLANDRDFNYGLVASGTITTPQNGSARVNYADTVEQPLVFVRNNSQGWVSVNVTTTYTDFWGWQQDPYGINGRRLSAPITIPYKIFAPFKNLGNLSGQNYGIQVFDSGGNKTFDSNYEIPRVAGSVLGTIPTPNNGAASPIWTVIFPSGISSNPWFSISSISGVNVGLHVPASSGPNAILYICARAPFTGLEISFGVVEIGTFSASTFASGAGTNRLFYLMNEVPAALDATILFATGTTSCTYDPALTSACSTSQVYNINPSGGNGTAITYVWSLTNNTGSLSINGSTTGSSVTVVKAGSGTTTYNATLQCVITQSGSSITRTINISSVHTASANPLAGGAITASNVTSTCTYTGSGGTCTTSETHTLGPITGGNGGALTYSWDFAANAGGFSFSTGTTGSSVGITRNATAGTYTCTTRCTISQNGSTPLVVTYAVSHTHTESSGTVINPLGFNGQTKSDSDTISCDIGLNLLTDGTWSIVGSLAGTITSGNWWSLAPTTGIGNNYWCNFILNSTTGTGSNSSTSGWNQLTTTRSVSVLATAPTVSRTRSANYTVQISATSAGSVLSSSTIQLTAIAIYDSGQ